MARFRDLMAVPPGGVYFYEVSTARGPVRIEAPSFEELVSAVETFQDLNSIPRDPLLRERIQEYMCRFYPDFCDSPGGSVSGGVQNVSNAKTPVWRVTGGFRARPRSVLTVTSVFEFTRLLFMRVRQASGTLLCTPEEATSRAKVCIQCPLNRTDICSSICHGAEAFVRSLVGYRSTEVDVGLGVCELCGCFLRAKVHISKAALRNLTPPDLVQAPDFCWLHDVYRGRV